MKLFTKEEKRTLKIAIVGVILITSILFKYKVIGQNLFGGNTTVHGISKYIMDDAVTHVANIREVNAYKNKDITLDDLERLSQSKLIEDIKNLAPEDSFWIGKKIEEDLYGEILRELDKVFK